jgi:murein DD-endopeptidase MepM/ murein hydrolase activator NlpD
VTAARETASAIGKVKTEASGASTALGHHTSALGKGTTEMGRFTRGTVAGSGALGHLGRAVAFSSAAFLGGAGLISVLKQSVSAGSDLFEQQNKVNVVFGQSAGIVKAWSRDAATSMGIARHEALAFAGTFGNLLVPMGFARADAAKMSTALVQLASDMASFNNASPEDTLRALQSGLAGQVRPLRQFGVFLDQNRIKAVALADGIVKADVSTRKLSQAQSGYAIAQGKLTAAVAAHGPKSLQAAAAQLTLSKAADAVAKAMAGNVPALTAAQKATATYHIVLKDTKDAQGDFARTSHGLANQQRILKAQLSDVEGELGTALMPTLVEYMGVLTTWIQNNEKSGRFQRDFNQAVKIGGDVVNGVIPVIKTIAGLFRTFADNVGGTKHAVEILAGVMVGAKVLGGFSALTAAAGEGGAAGAIKLLSGRLRLLAQMGEIAVTVVVGLKLGAGVAKLLGLKEGWLSRLVGIDTPGQGGQPTAAAAKTYATAMITGRFPAGTSFTIDEVSGDVEVHDPDGNIVGAFKASDHSPNANIARMRAKTGKPIPASTANPPATTAAATTGTATAAATAAAAGKGIQLPTSQRSTHETGGLPGFPAVDIMATPGTPIKAPEDGMITRISGHEPSEAPPEGQGGPWGLTIYYVGTDSGNTYYMTHLMKVGKPGRYKKGQVIGLIGNYPGGADHVHYGIHQGASAESAYPSGAFAASDFLGGSGGGDTTFVDTAAPKGPTAQEKKLTRLDTAVSRAKAITPKNFKDDLAALNTERDYIRQLIAHGKGTRDLYDQLASLNDEIDALAVKPKKPKIVTGVHLLSDALQVALKGDKTGSDKQYRDLLKAKSELEQIQIVKPSMAVRVELAAIQKQLDKIDGTRAKKVIDGVTKSWQDHVRKVAAALKVAQQIWSDHLAKLKTIADDAQAKFDTAWDSTVAKTDASFDKTTDAYIAGIAKRVTAEIDGINKAGQAQLDAIDKTLAARLDAIDTADAVLTEAEQKAADERAAHDKAQVDSGIADARQALADAQAAQAAGAGGTPGTAGTAGTAGVAGHDAVTLASGDTVTGIGVPGGAGSEGTPATPADLAALAKAVVDAQKNLDELLYQQQQAADDELARLSRDAKDKQARADAQAATDAANAAKTASQTLTDQAVTDAQTRADNETAAYQTAREAEKVAMDGWLAYQKTQLDAGTTDWIAFYAGLVPLANAYGFDVGAAFIDAQNAGMASRGANVDLTTAASGAPLPPALSAGARGRSGTGNLTVGGFAGGGWASGGGSRTVDPRDTIMARLRPGEYVMSPGEVAAGRPSWAGGGGIVGDVYLDGQKVGVHVAKHVTNSQERQMGFPSLRS